MVPIATTTTLQKLTPAPELGTAASCTLSMPWRWGRWAGPTICEIEMKWGRYCKLLRITTYLLMVHIKNEILLFPIMMCKWEYIHSTFFSNWAMQQTHRGNILVKRTWRCSCSGCTIQKNWENVWCPLPNFSWSGLRSCLNTMCCAKHENVRSCDKSMQFPSCADGCLAGHVYLDIFTSWCLLQSACTYFILLILHDM